MWRVGCAFFIRFLKGPVKQYSFQTITLGFKLSGFNKGLGKGKKGHGPDAYCSQTQFLKAWPAR